MNGGKNQLVEARTSLLDALEALREHRDSIIVVGAQAVYLHTGRAEVALAETTKDSDLAIDSRTLAEDPRIEDAMKAAGFVLDPIGGQPGAWLSPTGIPVDLMVPERIAGSGRRSVRMPPHAKNAARRTRGLEAALVDSSIIEIASLVDDDKRVIGARVAGPAALLVAKLHKLTERLSDPRRLEDKDAHDIYRLLVAIPTANLAVTMLQLLAEDISSAVTTQAIGYLRDHFAAGPDAPGSMRAGRAEYGIGEPEVVSASASILSQDLLAALGRHQ